MTREIRIYIAGPLFSVAEREFNKRLAEALKARIDNCSFSLPQEYAASVAGQPGFLEQVFDHSLKSIRDSDVVIAVLDGPDVDAGTCVEIGYAYANRKPIIGVRTDFRASEDKGVNLMVSNACSQLIWLRDSGIELEHVLNEVVSTVKNFLPKISLSEKT